MLCEMIRTETLGTAAQGLDEAGSGGTGSLWNLGLEEDHVTRSCDGIGNLGLEEMNIVGYGARERVNGVKKHKQLLFKTQHPSDSPDAWSKIDTLLHTA